MELKELASIVGFIVLLGVVIWINWTIGHYCADTLTRWCFLG